MAVASRILFTLAVYVFGICMPDVDMDGHDQMDTASDTHQKSWSETLPSICHIHLIPRNSTSNGYFSDIHPNSIQL